MGILFDPYRQSLPPMSSREEEGLEEYYALLAEWNEKINLVSRKSFDRVVSGQFVDCLHILALAFPYLNGLPVIDIGSGGGFPGLRFAIRYPEIPITLYEKIGKKRDFLSVVKTELGLSNVEVREGFMGSAKAFAFARAVFSGDEFYSFFRQHLLRGSRIARNLGSAGGEMTEKGFRLLDEKRYLLPADHGERVLQILECST